MQGNARTNDGSAQLRVVAAAAPVLQHFKPKAVASSTPQRNKRFKTSHYGQISLLQDGADIFAAVCDSVTEPSSYMPHLSMSPRVMGALLSHRQLAHRDVPAEDEVLRSALTRVPDGSWVLVRSQVQPISEPKATLKRKAPSQSAVSAVDEPHEIRLVCRNAQKNLSVCASASAVADMRALCNAGAS